MDWLITFFEHYPYLGVCVIFLLCGIGLPIPDEVVLVYAGYQVFRAPDLDTNVTYGVMVAVCFTSILAGDLIPFFMGRFFGPRLLRLRFLRFIVTRQRLAMFDRWFRRRGDLVIFFARFVPGLRVVTYFTAGTMHMRWARFLVLDMTGILLITPLFVWVGWEAGEVINEAIARIENAERWITYTCASAAVLAGAWYWLRRRRRRLMTQGRREAYVEPSVSSEASLRLPARPEPPPATSATEHTSEAPAAETVPAPEVPTPAKGPAPDVGQEATGEPATDAGREAASRPATGVGEEPAQPGTAAGEQPAKDDDTTTSGDADEAREDDDLENLTPSRN